MNKNLFKHPIRFIFLFIITLFFNKCATPSAPKGGPKDTIPPTLIESDPIDQTIRYQGNIITLTFDERIAADKLKQNLIITPVIETKFKHFIKKNKIIIEFDEPFEDSTTYSLNFFDGITDITEKNPPENLVIAFSTGDFIDSLIIVGKSIDLIQGTPNKRTLVGIYKPSDTLDFKKMKPIYFTTTNEQGNFRIQNIKYGSYQLFSFLDDNKNLLFDAATESYSFKAQPFNPIDINDSIYLYTVQMDASPLNFISARPSGLYFEVKYSKPITGYHILDYDSTYQLFDQLDETKEIIRFYNPEQLQNKDSIYTVIESFDTLNVNRIDTCYVKFRSSSRKPHPLELASLPIDNTPFIDTVILMLESNKPIYQYSFDTLTISIDTLIVLKYPVSAYLKTASIIVIQHDLTLEKLTSQIDSLKNIYFIDTTSNQVDSAIIPYSRAVHQFFQNPINIHSSNQLISADHDTINYQQWILRKPLETSTGNLTINIQTNDSSYVLQLMSNKTVKYEKKNCNPCSFNKINTGTYNFRVLIDRNNDGIWSPGNLYELIEPEPVLFFSEATELRENWEVELDLQF